MINRRYYKNVSSLRVLVFLKQSLKQVSCTVTYSLHYITKFIYKRNC